MSPVAQQTLQGFSIWGYSWRELKLVEFSPSMLKGGTDVMLRVLIHSGPPSKIAFYNLLGRLDLECPRPGLIADYKATLFTKGVGPHPPVIVPQYPRWSASVWDLIARAVCLTLNESEAIGSSKKLDASEPAFFESLTLSVSPWPGELLPITNRVALAHIQRVARNGQYSAVFESTLFSKSVSSPFTFAPLSINPWELFVHAYAWAVHKEFAMPARPILRTPLPSAVDGHTLIRVPSVPEPARSGLRNWMAATKRPFSKLPKGSVEAVTEKQFRTFLETSPWPACAP